jgi:Transposase DNA-binding
MQLLKREFADLEDMRLLCRGNKILEDLFSSSTHSIRQISNDESSAKGFYKFLSNDRVSEEDIVNNLITNCKTACIGKYVVYIQDNTEINLSSHSNRIKKNDDKGTTNVKGEYGLGFMLHPSFMQDCNIFEIWEEYKSSLLGYTQKEWTIIIGFCGMAPLFF